MSLGARSVAVPVLTPSGVVAALGIVVPSLGRNRPRLVSALQVAVRGIARSVSETDFRWVEGESGRADDVAR